MPLGIKQPHVCLEELLCLRYAVPTITSSSRAGSYVTCTVVLPRSFSGIEENCCHSVFSWTVQKVLSFDMFVWLLFTTTIVLCLSLGFRIPRRWSAQGRQKRAQEFMHGLGCWWSPTSVKNLQHMHCHRASEDWYGWLPYGTLGWKPWDYFKKAWQGYSRVTATS